MNEQINYTLDKINQLPSRFRGQMMNSLSGFKNTVLIGSQNSQGDTNLAIFSQVFHIGANPPALGILFRPHTVARHTLENILEHRYFTVNYIPMNYASEAHHTAAKWDGSEFEHCGFGVDYQNEFPAPYVKESTVRLGLSYEEHSKITFNDTILLVGKVLEVSFPSCFQKEDGYVDLSKGNFAMGTGMDAYHSVSRGIRFSYPEPHEKPKIIRYV
ncbi:MAG: flavin reductase [Cyclobacteriaceae bacterium]|nr:flavin reductase [Cyclobacteriaceae bacterium]MCH8516566.1 flavin reductase [Cyclobacteriaceae bacterium]